MTPQAALPVPVLADGTPLCMSEGFTDNPNAMMVLWKDHTAIAEADAINRLARSWGGEDFTKYEGGIYSSEWFWAKIWHVIKEDATVQEHAYSWVEHCDLMTSISDRATIAWSPLKGVVVLLVIKPCGTKIGEDCHPSIS